MKFGNRMRAGLFLLFVLLPNACADGDGDSPSAGASPPDPFALPAPPPSGTYDGPLFAFKALPIWFNETNQEGELKYIEAFNDYRGLGRSVLGDDGKTATKGP